MAMMKRLYEENLSIVYDVVFRPRFKRKWHNPFATMHGATIMLRNKLGRNQQKALLIILDVICLPFDLCFVPGAYWMYRKGKALGYHGSFNDWQCCVLDVGNYLIEEAG